MTDELDFGPPDDALRNTMARLAPTDDDTTAAYDRVMPRAMRARRRRRVASAVAGSAVAVIAVAGILSISSATSPQTVEIDPAGSISTGPRPEATVQERDSSTSSSTSSTTSPRVPTTEPESVPDSSAVGTTPSSTPPDVGVPAAPATDPVTVPSVPSSETTPATGPETEAPEPAQPSSSTYSGAGGQIRVDFDGSSLTLVQVTETPGFTSEIENQEADRIRVLFTSPDHETRIEVRVTSDGQVEDDVDENDKS